MRDLQVGLLAKAVRQALGIGYITDVQIGESLGDTTRMTITFHATTDQMKRIGEAMQAEVGGEPRQTVAQMVATAEGRDVMHLDRQTRAD